MLPYHHLYRDTYVINVDMDLNLQLGYLDFNLSSISFRVHTLSEMVYAFCQRDSCIIPTD